MITMQQAIKDCGWLGDIVAIHSLGPYDLAEYVQRGIGNSEHNGETFFAIFIDGERTSNSASTIDQALIYAIAKRNLKEPNTANWYSGAVEKLLLTPNL